MHTSASPNHQKYHYSITCRTTDLAVLHCLRAIAQHVEKDPYAQIGWGGTTEKSWKRAKNHFTVRFTDPAYRIAFINEASRLLGGLWTLISTDDNDPASRQR
jgi:hypothetical protein